MKKIFLHIGVPKAGSTSIQHFLFKNSKILEKNNFFYPTNGDFFSKNELSHAPLAISILANDEVGLEKYSLQIREAINSAPQDNIIISTERFSNIEDVKKIKNIFLEVTDDIVPIIYLRRQDKRLESAWAQGIKMGRLSMPFDDFINLKRDWNYFTYIEKLATEFESSELIVRPFEKLQLLKGDVVSDFLGQLGLQISFPISKDLNISPPIEFLELSRIMGRDFITAKEKKMLNKFLLQAFNFNGEKFQLFTNEIRLGVLNSYEHSNKLVAQKYLKREDGILFFDPLQSDLPFFPGVSKDRLNEAYRKVLHFIITSRTSK